MTKYNKLLVTILPMLVILWNTYKPEGAPEVRGDQIDAAVNTLMVVLTPFLVWLVPNDRRTT